ncbi:undecaprenyl/decaprenyl-phosphate alpha-N-acetylglucosaminyl 1-phosphate transferase [Nitrosomonas sp. JL21]|uniref:glycosyltransferase family 4 protein n=1 Tax=Nitrosomonas sp. JL21 TaxID=153949 RepID=UPI001371D406|nr:MraY family glycosyltransferase [Nitrosomonas sp. JL21]MBL8496364.1 undecaprenyl/decaprenyl-phosphate alpha-N-acetylglucosaminyl 1-phosphate transferase [Nitrosomonas sp.]MXS77363.1 undecaprenyl/decaprenyl-phosphate alpha-N-acetylglucosaminyl 1-phosphate transferase [Nitrosomonas sp. JL21]
MNEISIELLGLIFWMTLFLSALLIPVAIKVAMKVGAMDIPKHRSMHKVPKPRLGGLAISISLILVCLIFLPFDVPVIAFLSGLVVIVITGVIDDIKQISPTRKLLGQVLAALVFVYLSGMRIEEVGDIFGLGEIYLNGISFFVTVFFSVGMINALNLADGLDSLAGGISAIALIFLGYFAWNSGQTWLLVIAVSLLGAIFGFLRFNSYPTRSFMGDNGSMMLGYVLAVMFVSLGHSSHQPLSALAMVVALPLLDTLIVMGRRIYNGHNPFHSDRTHLHHCLIDLGLPHPEAVALIYMMMFCFGLLAISVRNEPDWVIFASLMGVGLFIFSSIWLAQSAGMHYNHLKTNKLDSIRQLDALKSIAYGFKVTAQPIGAIILLALLLPALFAPVLTLSSDRVLLLYAMIALLVFLTFRIRRAGDLSIVHGILFLCIFSLLFVYKLSSLIHPSWLGEYVNVLSAIALSWVALKLFFTKYSQVIFAADFELLILLFSGFIAYVLMEELPASSIVLQAIQHAFLLAIPFLLVMKINIHNYGQTRKLLFPIIITLVIVLARASV